PAVRAVVARPDRAPRPPPRRVDPDARVVVQLLGVGARPRPVDAAEARPALDPAGGVPRAPPPPPPAARPAPAPQASPAGATARPAARARAPRATRRRRAAGTRAIRSGRGGDSGARPG